MSSDSENPPSPSDTTLLRVSRDGHTVTMLYALESRDPLVRRPGNLFGGSASTGEGESDSDTLDRLFSLRTRNGYATDVLVVTARYIRGQATAEAEIFRSTPHGTRDVTASPES